jgi:hypothetical protein
MNIIPKKQWLLFLAALVLVMMGIMAYVITIKKSEKEATFEQQISEMKEQSNSDNLNDIEEDVDNTDFSDVDKELNLIEKELE